METLGNTGNDGKNLVIEVLKTQDLANSLQTGELKKELIGKEDAIIKDLKENCVRPGGDRLLKKNKGNFILKGEVKKKDLYDGLKGRIVEVDIPTVENFIGSSSSYFISDSEIGVQKGDFESGGFETIACSVEDVTKFLESIRTYFGVYGVKIDENIDYENDLGIGNDTRHGCVAGTTMKQLLNLKDGTYWLGDLDEDGKRIKLTIFDRDGLFYFQKANKDYVEANVLAKLNCLIEE